MHTSTFSTILSLALFTFIIPTAIAQTTVPGVSEIPDGQIQVQPEDSSSTTTAIVSSSSAAYENPFTIYTSQTNSLGVVTGMPAVVTSQPLVATSQPDVITSQPSSAVLPTLSGFYYNTTTSTSSEASSIAASTLTTSTVGASGSSGSSGSRSASATIAQATGGAVANRVAGAGFGLVVLGLAFSLL
jgi:hypothetical protein